MIETVFPTHTVRVYPEWMRGQTKRTQVRFPKNRTKRLMKKFRKNDRNFVWKEMRDAFAIGNVIYLHQDQYDALLKHRNNENIS